MDNGRQPDGNDADIRYSKKKKVRLSTYNCRLFCNYKKLLPPETNFLVLSSLFSWLWCVVL